MNLNDALLCRSSSFWPNKGLTLYKYEYVISVAVFDDTTTKKNWLSDLIKKKMFITWS